MTQSPKQLLDRVRDDLRHDRKAHLAGLIHRADRQEIMAYCFRRAMQPHSDKMLLDMLTYGTGDMCVTADMAERTLGLTLRWTERVCRWWGIA